MFLGLREHGLQSNILSEESDDNVDIYQITKGSKSTDESLKLPAQSYNENLTEEVDLQNETALKDGYDLIFESKL